MKIFMAVVWAILLIGLVASAAIDSKKEEDSFLLTRNTPVRISAETGWKRHGLTPVQLNIRGLNLTLWMDGEGWVLDEAMFASQEGEKTAYRYQGVLDRETKMNGRQS